MAELPSPIQELDHPILQEKKIQLFVKRDDLIHDEIMGNKWRKLKYNLFEAKEAGKKRLVTLGGAYSNHIYATAAACCQHGFESVGIIRGEELNPNSNTTLQFAVSQGMQLRFVDRSSYKKLRTDPSSLLAEYPNSYILPEGGTNKTAIKGCSELVDEIRFDFDVLSLPIGTGGTFCGVLDRVKAHQRVLGVSSLKGDFIHTEIENLIKKFNIRPGAYSINNAYDFGGYGKTTPELIEFINWFKENHNIPLDPIYTGKSFFAVWDMIKNDKFEKNLRIVLLHTGGLQGISGFNRKNENIIQ